MISDLSNADPNDGNNGVGVRATTTNDTSTGNILDHANLPPSLVESAMDASADVVAVAVVATQKKPRHRTTILRVKKKEGGWWILLLLLFHERQRGWTTALPYTY